MIRGFKNKTAKSLAQGEVPKRFPKPLLNRTRAMLGALNAAEKLGDLRFPPGNHLEKLDGDRKGQHSVRINRQWRICFVWTEAGPKDVEIVDYH